MNIFEWLTRQCTVRKMVLSLYRQGMARAKRHDHRGAIDVYAKAIDMPDTPTEVKAMVLCNCTLVLVATGDVRRAVGNFETVVAIDEAPVNVMTMARQKLAKMESRRHKRSG